MDLRATGNSGADKARNVREMFGSIAHRYDFLNHLLSGNIDRLWRRRCLREVAARIGTNNPTILDVGCGTADLSLTFSRLGRVVGCDFCHPMLKIGMEKVARRQVLHPVTLVGGDALHLPFGDQSFDAVVSAFCLRNLADMRTGLKEMYRVLRPGGVVGILDFGMPEDRLLAGAYRFYFQRILPKIGALLSGVRGPYQYLPDSVESFAAPAELRQLLEEVGFVRPENQALSAGIAILLLGRVHQGVACRH
jgi:demethylmenaquinone methyltransferase/2-methoxy-6-polyprenyl-1,4-benzoquinol methylase